jgi:hypothetical protein
VPSFQKLFAKDPDYAVLEFALVQMMLNKKGQIFAKNR